jgi:type II secretory ATPase GspE/PulE/Tfp pilus assembly ATPase PilB-like protein
MITSKDFQGYLVTKNLVTYDKLTEAKAKAESTAKTVDEILLDMEAIQPLDLAKAKAEFWNFAYIDVSKLTLDSKTLNTISEKIAKKNKIVAYDLGEKYINVVTTNPENFTIVDFLQKSLGKEIRVSITDMVGLDHLLSQYQKTLEAEFSDIVGQEYTSESNPSKASPEELQKAATDLPIIQIVDTIIKHAILEEASDIHIESSENNMLIRYRVDGILRDAMTLPKAAINGVLARIKVLANLKLDERRLPQDGRFRVKTDEYQYSFRVSTMPIMDGEKAVLRLLNESTRKIGLEKLGFEPDILDIVARNISRPNGIILLAGPTGSGKTTTLYTILGKLNTSEVNVCTIEDPIEYRMKRVNQTQTNSDIGMTFASGLRALLRQDPDIIMVGEIRDQETATIAMQSALTGHLVLSTIHTNSASGTIPRLLDMGIEPFLIASSMNLVIAQRLVRTLCPKCKESYTLDKNMAQNMEASFDIKTMLHISQQRNIISKEQKLTDITFYRPKGCSECNSTGYRRRQGIYEVLEITDNIKKIINLHTSTEEINTFAKQKNGLVTLAENAFMKCIRGETSLEEMLRLTKE